MASWAKYDSDIPDGHAFAETRDLQPRDKYLRDHGFRIVSRKKGEEAVWKRRDTPPMTESVAVAWCDGVVDTIPSDQVEVV